jgi:hypothetical protein
MTASANAAAAALSPVGATHVAPGNLFAASASVEAVGVSQSVETILAFYNSSGQGINAVFGPATTEPPGGWATPTAVSGVAPTNAASVVFAIEVQSDTTGEITYVDDAWITTSPSGSAPVSGPLHTSGNQILDANGNPVLFHGVNLNGLEASAAASGVTYDAVEQAKAWGANFVRVPLGEQFWLSSNCDYVPSYASTVDQVVNWITSLGMVAMLDLHFNTVGGCEAGSQHDMADEAQAPTFWSQVAARYASNPLVAFDLYNEPHDISDAVWLNGGTVTDVDSPNQKYIAAGMQQLYDTVRATGATNLVFISGNNWANTVPATLVAGTTNVVYAVHAYTCPDSAPPNCSSSSPYDPSPILDNFLALSSSMPVMVTEFGWPSKYDGTYIANVISFAQSHGWGWSAFTFDEDQYSTNWDLADSWLVDGTAEPAPSGMPVLCGLEADNQSVPLCTAPAPTAPLEISLRTTSYTADAGVAMATSAPVVSGGSGSYTFSSGTLPPGLTLSPSTGVISGTPSTPGTSSVTLTVADSTGDTQSASIGITVLSAPSISPLTASYQTEVGLAFSTPAVSVSGGESPYTRSASGLPAGLGISGSTGVISGTPETAGTYNVTLTAADSIGGRATQSLSIEVLARLAVSPTSASYPARFFAQFKSKAPSISGGSSPYRWSSSTLPGGLTLNTSTGVISGTPSTVGTYQVTLTVTDSTGAEATQAVTISINLL